MFLYRPEANCIVENPSMVVIVRVDAPTRYSEMWRLFGRHDLVTSQHVFNADAGLLDVCISLDRGFGDNAIRGITANNWGTLAD